MSLLLTPSCSSDNDSINSNNNSVEIAQIENEVESGIWVITSFVDSGQDETNNFINYNFTFSTNGTLIANNGTITMTGTWSVTTSSNSNDDSSSNDDIDFNIFFPVPETNDFEDLIDDWEIVTHNSNTISLIDVSGGNGDTDILVFQKN
ncbi:MAG: hypothetical protein DRI75_08965 [Bacteroidetes bacterium]|nr:MAG: hypothetical protein DRI75_08965 [Bacteroidota bacterium]